MINNQKTTSEKIQIILLVILIVLVTILIFKPVQNEEKDENSEKVKEEIYTEVLYEQPINFIYNEVLYAIDAKKTVDIVLMGDKADVYIEKDKVKDNLTVDLSELGPGKHKVKIKYNPSTDIEYKIDPQELTVEITPLLSTALDVEVNIKNSDNLNISETIISMPAVVVTGAEKELEKVKTIQATIDLKDIDRTSNQTTFYAVNLKAYNQEDEVKEVVIHPNTVDITVYFNSVH